jgi:hypothetical protein
MLFQDGAVYPAIRILACAENIQDMSVGIKSAEKHLMY